MDFESYTEEQQAYFLIDSKEHYLSYALLIQSGNHYRKLKMDLHNDFTTVNKIYPNSCPQNLHMLDKYSKIDIPKIPASEGIIVFTGILR